MTRMTYRGSSLDGQLWCIQGIRCPWSYTHTIYSNVLSIHLHNLSTHYHFTIPRGPSSKMFKVLVPELLGCFHTCEPSGSMPAFPRNPQLCHAAVSFHDANTDSKYQFGLQTSGSELFTSVGSLNMFEYVWICLNPRLQSWQLPGASGGIPEIPSPSILPQLWLHLLCKLLRSAAEASPQQVTPMTSHWALPSIQKNKKTQLRYTAHYPWSSFWHWTYI